jgi:hypothetical protein
MRQLLVAVALLAAGCVANENDAKPKRSSPPPPPPPVAAPPKIDAAPAAEVKLPERAEVELSGVVEVPADQPGDVQIWVTDGPCWQKTSHMLSRAGATRVSWGVEVVVPQGTQLWICGRLAPRPGQKSTLHAEAGPFPGKGAGEVIFSNVKLALKPGAPVEEPPPLPPAK